MDKLKGCYANNILYVCKEVCVCVCVQVCATVSVYMHLSVFMAFVVCVCVCVCVWLCPKLFLDRGFNSAPPIQVPHVILGISGVVWSCLCVCVCVWSCVVLPGFGCGSWWSSNQAVRSGLDPAGASGRRLHGVSVHGGPESHTHTHTHTHTYTHSAQL